MNRVPKRYYIVIDCEGVVVATQRRKTDARQIAKVEAEGLPEYAPHTVHAYALIEKPEAKKRRKR
jgi:hypothetical protein